MTNVFIDFFYALTFFAPTLSTSIFKHRGWFRLFVLDSSSYKFRKVQRSQHQKQNTFNVPLIQPTTETTEFSGMKREKPQIGDGRGGGAGGRAEDEGEEVEMEKFWELVGILREEVGHRRSKAENEEEGEKRKKRKEEKGWVPAFEKEDFIKDIEFVGLPLIFPRPCNHIKKDEEKQEDCKVGLDLKLKL